jgi:hypothetical protein
VSRLRIACAALCALAAAALLPRLAAAQAEDARPEAPAELLRRAFDRRYGADTHQQMTLRLRSDGREVQRQRIEVVTKMEAGQLRALARFTAPPDLRNTALLVLEQEGRPDDYFLYLPAIDRVRRVSGAQRSDSFMGTDLTYEDLERRRLEEFEDLRAGAGSVGGEPVVVVSARPRIAAGYERVEFAIAPGDAALLETRYFAKAAAAPFKVIRFPRAQLHEEAGFSVPTRIDVANLRKGTETEVTVDELRLNPGVDIRLFTTDALLREAKLDGSGAGPPREPASSTPPAR